MSAAVDVAILDFDGTLVDLDIDWRALRARLNVASIDHLFAADDAAAAWATVRDEEVAAAATGRIRRDVIDEIGAIPHAAILTANSEDAVAVFLEREPAFAGRVVAVVGRETMQGPKRDQSTFSAAFARCLTSLQAIAGPAVRPIYFGDQDYELAFAGALGAVVRDARTIGTASTHEGSAL